MLTAFVLLAVGIAATEIVLRACRHRAIGDERGQHVERIHRLAELSRTGEIQIALDQVALHATGPPTEVTLSVTCGQHEWGQVHP